MWNSDRGPATVPVHSVENNNDPEWKQAEAFRKTGIFGRAARYFRERWDEHEDPEAGWRYAHCLRKTGYHEVAISLLAELHRNAPLSDSISKEYVWALYEGRLAKAKDEGNQQGVLEAAREIVGAGAEGTALKLAVFAVISAAKTKGQWNQVSNWCDLLNPATLSASQRQGDRGTIPSDRERWYFGKLKALVKLEDWHLAEQVANFACEEFPQNESFVRWKAQAKGGLGQVNEALTLLQSLGPKAPWYVLADQAKLLFRLEQVERAWELAVKAARAPGQLSAKVNLWGLMSRLSLALGRAEAALDHLALEQRVRQEQGWPLRPHHLAAAAQVKESAGVAELPDRPGKHWIKICQNHWNHHAASKPVPPAPTETAGSEQMRYVGHLTAYDAVRSFAFIEREDNGEQVFVLTKDLPEQARKNRARLEFQIIDQFDKRKNRQSQRAVQLNLLTPTVPEWGNSPGGEPTNS